jgi:hypothetical protein
VVGLPLKIIPIGGKESKSCFIMKILLLFFIVFSSVTSQAAKYYEATVVFVDGKSRTGLAESSFGDLIFFKASENAEVEKLESSSVKSIVFTIKGEKKEYHQHKIYLGWGQKRMSDYRVWLQVVEKGIATLYVNHTTLASGMNQQNKAGFQDYYCIREGEPAAKLICQVSTMNNNQTFRAKAPLYFEDYPELSERIKSKELTWKELVPVVQEYNQWAAKK